MIFYMLQSKKFNFMFSLRQLQQDINPFYYNSAIIYLSISIYILQAVYQTWIVSGWLSGLRVCLSHGRSSKTIIIKVSSGTVVVTHLFVKKLVTIK